MLVIDGHIYDADATSDTIMITGIEETFDILVSDKSTRLQNGGMFIDPIGTYYSHEITFHRRSGCSAADWDELYQRLSDPNCVHTITIDSAATEGQNTITYDGYVSGGARPRKHTVTTGGVTEKFWGDFSIKFTPMEPQRRP